MNPVSRRNATAYDVLMEIANHLDGHETEGQTFHLSDIQGSVPDPLATALITVTHPDYARVRHLIAVAEVPHDHG